MRTLVTVVLLAAAVGLGGCVVAPPQRPQEPLESAPVAPPPEQVAEVVAYPAQGQSEQQLDRDRYECHVWAVKQTGFDPSVAGVPPHQRVRVVAGPAPSAVPGSAFTGAILGAIVSRPRDAGIGALIGAVAGTAVGAASDASRAQATQQVVASEQARLDAQTSQQESQAGGYRRALGACLAGRGYTIR